MIACTSAFVRIIHLPSALCLVSVMHRLTAAATVGLSNMHLSCRLQMSRLNTTAYLSLDVLIETCYMLTTALLCGMYCYRLSRQYMGASMSGGALAAYALTGKTFLSTDHHFTIPENFTCGHGLNAIN